MPLIPGLTSREALINALTDAADLEHAVMCQYLFAAFSLKSDPMEGGLTWPQAESVREWKATLLLIARQEMEHLGLACNLLTAIGGMSAFRTPSFPSTPASCPNLGTFQLNPLSSESIARFMVIEKMHETSLQSDMSAHRHGSIGSLYAEIREGLHHLAQTNALAFIGAPETQVTNADMGLRDGLYDMRMCAVTDIDSACRAIDQIVEAGDGTGDTGEPSHYQRFANIQAELALLSDQDPEFRPARRVADNPSTGDGPSRHKITHPTSRMAAQLFDMAFSTQLLLLTRFFSPTDETPEEREGLRKLAFFPMMTMVLRPLGELLTMMPLADPLSPLRAGPCFEPYSTLVLPFRKESAWMLLHERMLYMFDRCHALCLSNEDDTSFPTERLTFLRDNLERLALNFEHFMGLKQLTRSHLVKRLI